MQPRIPLAFLVTRTHCWLMFNSESNRTSRSFSAKLSCFPAGWPVVCTVWGCSSWGSGLCDSPCWIPQVCQLQCFQPTEVPLQGGLLSFVSSAYLLRVNSTPSSRSFMKMLNKTGLSNDPWDTPLIPTRLCTIDHYPSFQSTSVSSARPHFKSFSMRTLWIPYQFTNSG